MRCLLVVVAFVSGLGCADFATPAELTKPTILAIVAEPPLVAPGAETELSVILAGPDGPMAADAVDWALVESLPGIPAFGTIEPGATGTATYTAPDPLPELPEGVPPITSVAVAVDAGDTAIESIKVVGVADFPAVNPRVTVLAIGGVAFGPGETVALDAGGSYALDVGIDPAPGEDAAFAWYTTARENKQYQSNPCELIAADEPRDDAWLFVVLRDGLGGVVVRGQPMTVE
jgi:hypothetical protein